VTGEYGVDHLRHHGVVKSQDAREEIGVALNFADEVVTEFVLNRSAG
jgi:hypothetical protein